MSTFSLLGALPRKPVRLVTATHASKRVARVHEHRRFWPQTHSCELIFNLYMSGSLLCQA